MRGFSLGRCAVFAFHTFVGCTFFLAFCGHTMHWVFSLLRVSLCFNRAEWLLLLTLHSTMPGLLLCSAFVSKFSAFLRHNKATEMIHANSCWMSVDKKATRRGNFQECLFWDCWFTNACTAVQFHFDEEVLLTNLLGNEERSAQIWCLSRPDPSLISFFLL